MNISPGRTAHRGEMAILGKVPRICSLYRVEQIIWKYVRECDNTANSHRNPHVKHRLRCQGSTRFLPPCPVEMSRYDHVSDRCPYSSLRGANRPPILKNQNTCGINSVAQQLKDTDPASPPGDTTLSLQSPPSLSILTAALESTVIN